jgi:chorismate mutase
MADRPGVSGDAAVAREQIDALRRRIDDLDERLVQLLNDRAGCALEIGRIKQALGMEIYQPDREREVHAHAIVRLFERIIDEARRLERMGQR